MILRKCSTAAFFTVCLIAMTMVFSLSLYAQQKPGSHGQMMMVVVKQSAGKTRTITLVNNCKQDIWWGSAGNAKAGGFFASPGNGGDHLAPGARQTISVNLEKQNPGSNTVEWSGRIWPRTVCSFTPSGVGLCETGGCGDQLHCKQGLVGTPPASLAEFFFGENVTDTYDLSYVDGTNVPIQIKPTTIISYPRKDEFGCTASTCTFDFAKENSPTDESSCLNALKVRNTKGVIVGCNSACQVFDAGKPDRMANSQYCCTGNYSGPPTRSDYGNCPPTSYATFFKNKCKGPYPWPQGDKQATYACIASAYEVTFCPQ
jgi:hypothetical protein